MQGFAFPVYFIQPISLLYISCIFRDEMVHVKLPSNIEDAKELGKVLNRYKDRYFTEVLGAVFIVYILYPLP